MNIEPKEINWTSPLKSSRGFTLIELMVVLIIIAIVGSILLPVLRSSGYSNGSRAGIVTKFSNKGVVNKSWEGELSMGGLTSDSDGNIQANTWQFSVVDPAAIDKIQKALDSGSRVKLTYTQGRASITRDTTYLVTEVTPIGTNQ